LKTVGEIMRQGDALRIADSMKTIREIFTAQSRPGRRTGAVILVDDEGRLAGVFTDSDLARLLERRCDEQIDRPISESMTCRPLTIGPSALLTDAIEILSKNRISELPVVDDEGRPIGIVDITDVVGVVPGSLRELSSAETQT
jgi:arabinose-5-phosphate isomerase